MSNYITPTSLIGMARVNMVLPALIFVVSSVSKNVWSFLPVNMLVQDVIQCIIRQAANNKCFSTGSF